MKPLSINSGNRQAFVPAGGEAGRGRWLAWLVAIVVAPTLLMAAARGAAGPAPVSAEELGLAFEHTCTPDTLRPNEWAVIECVARSTNQSQDTLSDVGWSVGGTYSGTVPGYFFVWSKRDGEFQPVGTAGLIFGGYDLRPGQTVETRTVLLLRMAEGTFETGLDLSVGGREVLTQPNRFVAKAEAADPPKDLLVTNELVGGPAGEEAMPTATYETKIMNQGSSAVTQLRVTDRYDEYLTLVSPEPAPSTQSPSVELASWDLAAFGKDSLAPGESLVLLTTYGPAADYDCGYVMSGVVVEATVDGQERRYGARAEEEATVGECDSGGTTEGPIGGGDTIVGGERRPVESGRGGPSGPLAAPPATGEGPSPSGGDAWWAAAVLAAGGASLIGAALALRRRSRR
jgi:hypothetical protein